MSKKSCGDCIHYDSALSYCRQAKAYLYALFGQKECPVTDKPQTVFHEITDSPEVLAEKLVYQRNCKMIHQNDKSTLEYWTYSWKSSVIKGQSFETKEEAISATVARLNSTVKSEVDNEETAIFQTEEKGKVE